METSNFCSNGSIIHDRRLCALGDLKVLPDEIICSILNNLTPRDVARLSCVSSVMYIFCNEEPLWLTLCLRKASGVLRYEGSWKQTVLSLENAPEDLIERCTNQIRFDGFSSLFLYMRFYRCNTKLDDFGFDSGNVDRKDKLTLQEFSDQYDGHKPVLLTGLSDSWLARTSWTIDQLCQRHGDTVFRISQMTAHNVSMKLRDYIYYMEHQHDEDPLYVFDAKFGESATSLLEDYSVPYLFQEDWFDVLDEEQRPPYRWLVIGPERSGASWHVDPALTSAWNTLICGRKRWAFYPPGRIPAGVTVRVNDDDGDVNIDAPSSLQWWLDYYPLIADEEKPIECTQFPGETIFVPSGWWHCVLNLENTVAVTQNFVNSRNFEYVCLDMAPGYVHKGVCRAGLLAADDDISEKDSFRYDIAFLSTFLENERDHYVSRWCPGNCIDQRVFREWLARLWIEKYELRPLIWKGACISLNADKWLNRVGKICSFCDVPFPECDDMLPSGFGSNPVYVLMHCAIKILVEGGLETALHCVGSEVQFHDMLLKVNSPLQDHIPQVLFCGILYLHDEELHVFPWEPSRFPNTMIAGGDHGFPFGVWSKKQHANRKADSQNDSPVSVWPFIVTKRCRGKTYAQLREELTWTEEADLASFLGEQLRSLHSLPYPALPTKHQTDIPEEWKLSLLALSERKKTVVSRLQNWGGPIPGALIELAEEYLPDNLTKLLEMHQGGEQSWKPLSWIHSDIMDDNVMLEQTSEVPHSWRGSSILDFSDVSLGDRLLDVIPIYVDIFRGNSDLLQEMLGSYGLPLGGNDDVSDKQGRLSYHAMCYCILHEDNVLGAVFAARRDLRMAASWEEVELQFWGGLNAYVPSHPR